MDPLEQKRCIENLSNKRVEVDGDWTEVVDARSKESFAAGLDAIRRGEVACLLLAGGQGSRLSFSGPKGTYPISPVRHKSLFQLLFEKVLYAGLRAGRALPLVVMTSSFNRDATIRFLEENNFFGLSREQLFFFEQNNLPVCDEEGNPITDAAGRVIEAPDGNGKALHRLSRSGILKRLVDVGVKRVTVIPVDNPLADPFDPAWIGCHARSSCDVSLIAVLREHEGEKAGVIGSNRGKPCVVEYGEHSDGSFSFVNTGQYCFNIDCIQTLVEGGVELPCHVAYKKIDGGRSGWKFEYFLFDLFPFVDKVTVIEYPRADRFAPLKNGTGENGPEFVRQVLFSRDQQTYYSLTGKRTDKLFELSQEFYYPRAGDLASWKGKIFPDLPYVTPDDLQNR